MSKPAFDPKLPATRQIRVRARSVMDNNDGTFILDLPCREVTNEEHKMLMHLFPNLSERAYHLLAQELLLDSIMTD